MLSFYWRLRGSVEVPSGISAGDLLDRLAVALADNGKDVVSPDSASLAFSSRFWDDIIGLNGHALSFYDHGRLWLDGSAGALTLRWELSSLHSFLASLLFAASVGLVVGSIGGPSQGLVIGFGAFCWVYGMYLLRALVQIPRFFRRQLGIRAS